MKHPCNDNKRHDWKDFVFAGQVIIGQGKQLKADLVRCEKCQVIKVTRRKDD